MLGVEFDRGVLTKCGFGCLMCDASGSARLLQGHLRGHTGFGSIGQYYRSDV